MNAKIYNYDSYIITSGEGVSFWIRLRDIVLTIIMWGLYIYFIRDTYDFLQEFVAWGMNGFHDRSTYPTLKILDTISIYAQVAGILGSVFIAWALYNLARFRGRNRRKFSPTVAVADLAAFYGHKESEIAAWQQSRTLVIHHDENGNVAKVEANGA
jgi:poly-beta-1,6-N-acetyl-D-glucosamine biosynthesis protein PgaD